MTRNKRLVPAYSSALQSEAGVTIPFFALLIAVFVMIASLVVDHSKEEIAVTNLQRSADAAALAAARQLNGKVDGWWNSKKAAALAVKRNPIHGANVAELSHLQLSGGKTSFWDDGDQLTPAILKTAAKDKPRLANDKGTEGSAGGVSVKVERGLYWRNADSSTGYSFTSLENDTDGLKGAVPYYFVANAVKVTVSLNRLNTVFGNIFGVGFFEKLKRESIAIVDNELEKNVAPIGIPLCQLLFDTSPLTTTGDHIAGAFNPNAQCERSTYVTEMNAKGDVSSQLDLSFSAPAVGIVSASERRDGLIRAESYERPPYTSYTGAKNLCYGPDWVGSAANCKALPLYATLGVPSGTPGGEASVDEVVESFTSHNTNAQIGSFFKPLPSLQGMSEDSVRAKLAEAINGPGSRSFRSAFMTGDRPTAAYPFGRTSRPAHKTKKGKWHADFDPQYRPTVSDQKTNGWTLNDLNISTPIATGIYNDPNKLKFQMGDMAVLPRNPGEGIVSSQLNYSNPMCHDDHIWHNDPDKARVREVTAMVLAPGLEEFGGDIVRYCDFERVFHYDSATGKTASTNDQRAVAPIPDSQPLVVGFVKVNLFDLNFQKLSTRPEGVADPRMQYAVDEKAAKDKDYNLKNVTQTSNTPVYLNGTGALFDMNSFALNFNGGYLFKDAVNNANEYEDRYKEDIKPKISDWAQRLRDRLKAMCVGRAVLAYSFCKTFLDSEHNNNQDVPKLPSSARSGASESVALAAADPNPVTVDPPLPSEKEALASLPDGPGAGGLGTDALDKLGDEFETLPPKWRECFDFDAYESSLERLRDFRHKTDVNGIIAGQFKDSDKEDLERAISDLRSELEDGIRARKNMHCLPRLKDNQLDPNSAKSFEPLRDLKPGLGCGAIRAKVSCDAKEERLISTGNDWSNNNPTLVSADD